MAKKTANLKSIILKPTHKRLIITGAGNASAIIKRLSMFKFCRKKTLFGVFPVTQVTKELDISEEDSSSSLSSEDAEKVTVPPTIEPPAFLRRDPRINNNNWIPPVEENVTITSTKTTLEYEQQDALEAVDTPMEDFIENFIENGSEHSYLSSSEYEELSPINSSDEAAEQLHKVHAQLKKPGLSSDEQLIRITDFIPNDMRAHAGVIDAAVALSKDSSNVMLLLKLREEMQDAEEADLRQSTLQIPVKPIDQREVYQPPKDKAPYDKTTSASTKEKFRQKNSDSENESDFRQKNADSEHEFDSREKNSDSEYEFDFLDQTIESYEKRNHERVEYNRMSDSSPDLTPKSSPSVTPQSSPHFTPSSSSNYSLTPPSSPDLTPPPSPPPSPVPENPILPDAGPLPRDIPERPRDEADGYFPEERTTFRDPWPTNFEIDTSTPTPYYDPRTQPLVITMPPSEIKPIVETDHQKVFAQNEVDIVEMPTEQLRPTSNAKQDLISDALWCSSDWIILYMIVGSYLTSYVYLGIHAENLTWKNLYKKVPFYFQLQITLLTATKNIVLYYYISSLISYGKKV